MNILFVVTEFPVLSETFIINQIVDLKKKGHTVHIYSHHKPVLKMVHAAVLEAGLIDNTFFPYNVPGKMLSRVIMRFKILAASIPNTSFFLIIKSFLQNNSAVSVYNFNSLKDKPKYDIIHAHFGVNGNLVTQLRKLGLFRKAKFITTFHGFDLNEDFAETAYYNDLFKECDTFTVNSNYSKKKLVHLGCDENKISVLPVGLDTTVFKKQLTEENIADSIKLMFVGRLIKLKGPHLFVEICNLLRKKATLRFRATIIGEGPLQTELLALINSYGLNEIVHLKGAMKQEKVLDEMNNADIFILPGITDGNLAEAQGLVIHEAQAMELPVVISDAGGMKEGIVDGITGFVVKENDLDTFVEKIELLASDVELRKVMGKEGRKFVVENYDIEKLNNKLIQIYLNN